MALAGIQGVYFRDVFLDVPLWFLYPSSRLQHEMGIFCMKSVAL